MKVKNKPKALSQKKKKKKNTKSLTLSKKSENNKNNCPKCGGKMIGGVCTKCNYSSKTAYKSRREAKEFTFAAD
jgi:predicted RNA-binding Zn-ribbon protein involved in translation (DUF1610 family)